MTIGTLLEEPRRLILTNEDVANLIVSHPIVVSRLKAKYGYDATVIRTGGTWEISEKVKEGV